jgi:hypothetical protein
MGEITEIQVSKGLTKQTSEKEWVKLEYTLKARVDCTEEVNVAKAQLEAVIDSWLSQNFQQKQQPAKEAKPALDTEHAEVYEKLNWEDRTGSKGSFQMLRRDSCNDIELFNHLEAMLKQNKGSLGIGKWHYWLGQDGFIFRRAKRQKQQQS